MGPVLKPALWHGGAGSLEHLWATVVREDEKERKGKSDTKDYISISCHVWVFESKGETCCRALISRSTNWFVSRATISLWQIRDLQNKAQSSIKVPKWKTAHFNRVSEAGD